MAQIRCSKETSQSGHFYRLVLQVTEATDIDPNIFLFLALPLRAGATDQEAHFQGVCSPKDMVDWPVGEPLPNANPPWLRHDTVDLLFPSLTEMNKGYDAIQEEIIGLCTIMTSLEHLTSSENVEFG